MLKKTVFAVPQMDCAAEERLIRMALGGNDEVRSIHADLAERRLTVVHAGPPDAVDATLQSLNLGSRLIDTADAAPGDSVPGPSQEEEARTLKMMLIINAGMFVAEAFGAIMATRRRSWPIRWTCSLTPSCMDSPCSGLTAHARRSSKRPD